jgi:hypothetical protein
MPPAPAPGILGNSLPLRRQGAVAARIVGDADKAAVPTVLDMAAECGGPACLDRPHDAALCSAKPTGTGLAISLTVVAEDVRHLQCGHHRHGSRSTGLLQLEPVEGAGRVGDSRGGNLGVAGRG